MQIDGYTAVISGTLIRSLLAILFLAFWIKDRRASWFAWWSAAFLLGDLATLIYLLGEFAAMFPPPPFVAAVLIAASACCWQGARAFEGRAILWLPVLGMLVLWLLACLIPGFIENLSYRVVLSSLLLALLIAMTAVEFWRGRQEKLPSRWAIIALFASLSAFFASRIALVGLAPYPFGALPMESSWLAAFSLVLILHTIVLAVLIVAMSRERLEREQKLKAQTDLLTGALNRHAFVAYGDRLMLRHETAGKPLCLLVFDLDQFKSLNDRFGHAGGDAILMQVVAAACENIRPGDLLFRLGGDEFCCLLPYTNMAQACEIGERVRDGIAAASMDVAGAKVKLTASIGLASAEAFGYALEVLLHEADMAVYAAKWRGRNKVVVAMPQAAGPRPSSRWHRREGRDLAPATVDNPR
jgi:diguanylate cyclase (GGDEF)-like protein